MTDPKLAGLERPCYRYQVVSGAGLYGKPHKTLSAAAKAAAWCAERLPGLGPFELERSLRLPGGGVRYWRKRGRKWEPWRAGASIEDRKPEMVWT